MTVSPRSVQAFQRFGLGARPGDLARAEADPVALLLTEIDPSRVMIPASPNLLSTQQGILGIDAFVAERRRQLAADPQATNPTLPANRARPMAAANAMATEGETTGVQGQVIYRNEVLARYEMARAASSGFAERLVWFWSNHFAISIGKGPRLLGTAGAFEREAIRPHVFGRFADMLLAVEQHPSMILYLDNNMSIGPNSLAGSRRGRGLNENLAREILELHTLGVNGGYTQEDVIGLARIITGWTVNEANTPDAGGFDFDPRRHEPGAHMVLKRSYSQPGLQQGQAVLTDLARHPATARHIATKLVRHFVADEPPQPLVDRLAEVFSDTDGDLAKVSRALVQAAESWEQPATKLRSPQEFLAAMLRATESSLDGPQLVRLLLALDHRPWGSQGPDGYSDTLAHWASPSGMRVRVDVASFVARRVDSIDPSMLLGQVLGSTASRETRSAVAAADSRAQGLAILFASPEFQRR
jgi:uncharacterized protein (DUF1800 family)